MGSFTREQGLKVLRIVKKVFDELGIPLFLVDGTCISAIRDNDLNLTDIDLGVLGEYENRCDEIRKSILNYGAKVLVWTKPQVGAENELWIREQSKFQGTYYHYTSINKKLFISFVIDGVWVDILFYYRYGNYVWRMQNPRMLAVYSGELFNSFKEIDFFGMKMLVPNPPEKYLEEQYGNWRTPIPRPFCCGEFLMGEPRCGKCGKVYPNLYSDYKTEGVKRAERMKLWEILKESS